MTEVETVEGEFTVRRDGHKLYTKTWKTAGDPKAILVFLHGFSDHCNAYNTFFTNLAGQKQIEVRSFDQRGWGRSVRKKSQRGLTGRNSVVLSDITSFIEAQLVTRSITTTNISSGINGSTTTSTNEQAEGLQQQPAATGSSTTTTTIPLFLMGHSMGGNEVISWMGDLNNDNRSNKAKSQIRGYLIQAPFIRDTESRKSARYRMRLLFLQVMGRIAPRVQVVNKHEASLLCRDPAENEAYVNDPLSHDIGTLQFYLGIEQRANAINSGKLVIPGDVGEGGRTRMWFGHGNADAFCEYNASKELVERSVQVYDRTLKTYEGGYHQLHTEPSPGKEMFLEDVSNWILARSGPLEDLPQS